MPGKILYIANKNKPGALELAERLHAKTEALGGKAAIKTGFPLNAEDLSGFELCCTIGGDGTLLSVLESALELGVPVCGVNKGKLGFLASFRPECIESELETLLKGEYQTQRRRVLHVELQGKRFCALNDVVVKTTDLSRVVSLKVKADGSPVNNFSCDGVILSSPTGSTSYNLSAGGPIIHPDAEVFSVTPVCPHTLSNRAIIVPSSAQIDLECGTLEGQVAVCVDGQVVGTLSYNESTSVRIHSKALELVVPREYAYFDVVREKLNW